MAELPAPRALPLGDEDARGWFILFPGQGPVVAWWHRLLRPGWRHCYAIRAITPELLLIIEHGGAAMRLEVVAQPIGSALRAAMAQRQALVLAVPEPPGPALGYAFRGPMTCVEVIKATLGIRAHAVITPRQLWRHLRRHHGALPVMPQPAG